MPVLGVGSVSWRQQQSQQRRLVGRPGSSSFSLQVSAVEQQEEEVTTSSPFPRLGDDGVYDIKNKEEHQAFLEANKDKLVVLKVYAPWCRACKGLAPKFLSVVKDEKYKELPIVWAQLTIQHNKDFVKSIGVIALPTIQFYVGGHISDTFPCGPSKFPILKRKLAQLVNTNVDPDTLLVKQSSIDQAVSFVTKEAEEEKTQAPAYDAGASTLPPPVPMNATAESKPAWTTTSSSSLEPLISDKKRLKYRSTMPFLSSLNLADFDAVMDKARLLTFEAGSVIMREGKKGNTFYIIDKGEVEICQKTYAEDPLQTSGSYLGTVVNRLEDGDYFGERALMTGEPRAASIRAIERTSCFAFDRSDFPLSSPLSGRTRDMIDLDDVNDKYGLSFGSLYATEVQKQLRDANFASQIRGSVNTPNAIKGVDTEDDLDEELAALEEGEELVANSLSSAEAASVVLEDERHDTMFNVLRRFKMIRQLNKVFEYIELSNLKWGDSGIRNRRRMLVKRLSPGQREEFSETFDMIDQDNSGEISFMELRSVMDSVLDSKTDGELLDMLSTGTRVGEVETKSTKLPDDEGRPELTKQDFLGIVAEAEFYFLFRDVFRALDAEETGFVKARELDRVLCGVRDLISDDRKSIIDVDDRDMLIDYEQFTRMLLGSSA
eukprot:CAMPEP_0172473534 /NCGR_PEP_ID=MMETSP1065-20121228/68903_1 /TAXON_ID=265537 /ORGANISM="Amphiprora paludosa, Strain CCMP125" /LENGTH=660 /DNA_ID=CAMNT_0013231709 /DNA_START=550 /DNA_END=2532 /DNA_ORIENTATION=+